MFRVRVKVAEGELRVRVRESEFGVRGRVLGVVCELI